MKKYYTYVYHRLDTGEVFYVGKGTGKRAWDRRRNKYCKAIIEKHGHVVEICAYWDTEQEAFEHEIFLIKCFRKIGHPLTNATDGGEGSSGHKHTDAHIAYMKQIMIGNKNNHGKPSPNKGKTLSEEWKKNLSLSTKGRPQDKEHSNKIAKALKGKPKSEAHREALRQASILAYARKKLKNEN